MSDIWNNIVSTPTEEGSTNFCRNVSIQGGSTNTGFPSGNGGIAPTSNCNNEFFSLNIKTAIHASNSNYNSMGILKCIDGNNDNVMTIGAKIISFFNGNTTFESSSSIEYVDLMKPSLALTNIFTIYGTTKIKNSILLNRSGVAGSVINLGGTGTGNAFDNIYGTSLFTTN